MAIFIVHKASCKLKDYQILTKDKWFTSMCAELYPLLFAG